MDYNSLTASKGTPGSLANWANYGLLPLSDVLTDAQAALYQVMRVREMRSALIALPIPLNATSVALPSDFLDPIAVFNQYMRPLPQKDPASLFPRMGTLAGGGFTPGLPTKYCIVGQAYNFDVAANAALSYWQIYYQLPQSLSAENPTNFLTTRYPHILRSACLVVSADFRKDDADYQRCSARLASLVAGANAMDDLSNRGIEVDADYGGASSYR